MLDNEVKELFQRNSICSRKYLTFTTSYLQIPFFFFSDTIFIAIIK